MSEKKGFDLRLQSIRGIAAFVVAFHHSFNIFVLPLSSQRILRGIEGVFSPVSAVFIFFILSGYVLGLSLRRENTVTFSVYVGFLMKRVCRIMIPLAVVILSASLIVVGSIWIATGKTFIDPATWGNSLMRTTYYRPFNLEVLATNLLLQDYDLDCVTWTITVEMVGSIFIPLFFVINKYFYPRILLILALIFLSLRSPDYSSGSYLYMFDLGLLIPFWIRPVFSSLRPMVLGCALLVAISICCLNSHLGHNFYVLSPALSFLLGYIIFQGNEKMHILDHQVTIWLGKVSYSFYLIHWPVLWMCGWLGILFLSPLPTSCPVFSSFLVFFVSILLTSLLAEISYRHIEVRSIHLGKCLLSICKTK